MNSMAAKAAAQNKGNANKGAYQAINASKEPSMGLITLPAPLEASISPNASLSVPPLYISPTKAIAIGAVPAAPIPCSARAVIKNP